MKRLNIVIVNRSFAGSLGSYLKTSIDNRKAIFDGWRGVLLAAYVGRAP
jgi:hypothetical protein